MTVEIVTAFVERRLEPRARVAAEEHISECSECREVVSAAVRARRDDADRDDGDNVTMIGTDISRYRIKRTIGAGAMGVIYLAYDPQLDRDIALKLVHPQFTADGDYADRLLSEARAMAKLNHRNIVAVFDAGIANGRVFMAMEFIEGPTLTIRTRSLTTWHDIVADYVQAGRGLAHAHAAGIVHRDFKPDNVLCNADRVAVTDFGLAQVPPVVSDLAQNSHEVTATTTVQAGRIVGTPAYMAPEQLRGEKASPLSDQFSFCVSLWEALYECRPFQADTRTALADAIQRKTYHQETKRTVPKRIAAILKQGLAAEPKRRFASMETLLSKLDAATKRRALAIAALSFVALSTLLGVLLLWRGNMEKPCQNSRSATATVWNAEVRNQLKKQFTRDNVPAEATGRRTVLPTIDRWVSTWQTTHQSICEATRIHGSQSEQLLDTRITCMHSKLQRVAGMVAAMNTATDVAKSSAELAGKLPILTDCIQRLTPNQLSAQAQHDNAQVQRALGTATLQVTSGDNTQAIALLSATLATTTIASLPALQAEIQLRLGDALLGLELRDQALDAYAKAAELAEPVAAYAIAAEATDAVAELHRRADNTTKVAYWTGRARAIANSAPQAPLAQSYGYLAQSTQLVMQRKYDDAVAMCEAAEASLSAANIDNDHYIIALRRLAWVHGLRRATSESITAYEKVAATTERVYGKGHPKIAEVRLHLAAQLMKAQQWQRATDLIVGSQHTITRELGETNHLVGDALRLRGIIAQKTKQVAEVEPLWRRAIAIYSARFGPTGDAVLRLRSKLASWFAEQENWTDAIREQSAVLATLGASNQKDSPSAAIAALELAEHLMAVGRYDEALAVSQDNLPRVTHPVARALEPWAHRQLMRIHRELAQWDQAIAAAKRTAELTVSNTKHQRLYVEALEIWGRSLFQNGRHHRGRTLVTQAAKLADRKGYKKHTKKLMNWLKRHSH